MKKHFFLCAVFFALILHAQTEEENYLKTYKLAYFSKNYDELDSLKHVMTKFSESKDDVIKKSIPSILKEIDAKLSSLDFDKYYNEKKNNTKIMLVKKYGTKLGESLANGNIKIGMTSQMVRDALGEPDNINNTETEFSFSSQWVYRRSYSSDYYYFENGKLKVIQD